VLPVAAVIVAAIGSPAFGSRTASVIDATTVAHTRAISIPMPEKPFVIIARQSARPMSAINSAAVASKPSLVRIRAGGALWRVNTRVLGRDLVEEFLAPAGDDRLVAGLVRAQGQAEPDARCPRFRR